MRDKILSFIREKGPVVPTDVSSFLRIDSVIASAYLSELVSSKIIKISSIKFGTSPLYYIQEQKKELEKFISGLNQQEKIAFEELKLNKILRESSLLPVLRVSIKNIKDFAIPLEVSFKEKKEVFWKWYELTNEEASPLIKKELHGSDSLDVEKKKESIDEELKQIIDEKQKLAQKQKVEEELKKVESVKRVEKVEKIEKTENSKKVEHIERAEGIEKVEKNEKVENIEKNREEKSIAEFTDDKFAIKVIQNLKERNVKITSLEVEKKNSELNLIIEIPTGVGDVTFYCKAKDKKRLNDVDVSSAFAEGYLKKLPVLLVTTGVLTKKGKERLEKDFKSVVFLTV